jgi:periplasmic copper chaperone A
VTLGTFPYRVATNVRAHDRAARRTSWKVLTMTRSLLLKRSAVVAAAAGLLTLAIAGPASAHVTVNPNTATQGGYTKITFRVPNETDNTNTTKLEVNFPADTPVASVSTKPVAGWTVATDKTKLATPIKSDDGEITEAVSKITWTASADAAIKPGQFQEFDVSLGPLPTAKQMIFKALQTYSDGNVVRWIDEPTTDGTEPEHPAPVLTLNPAGTATAAPAAATGPTVNAAADDTAGDSGNTGTGLGIAGIVLGLLGLVFGLLAYRRSGRPATAAAASSEPERVSAGK